MGTLIARRNVVVRVMIQVSEAQAAGMRRRAKEEGISIAELARQGIEIRLAMPTHNEEARRAALSAIGCLTGGPADLSGNHDAYFAEAALDHAS